MKVCVCVCPAACRRTHTSHHPEIWRRLLISPGLGTEPGGNPKCQPPGIPPIMTRLKFPEGLRIGWGPVNKSSSSGKVCQAKFYFWGAHPNPGAAASAPPMGVFALRILRRPANKSCSSWWVCLVKFLLWGARPNPEPAGYIPPNGGTCIENWARASKQKLLLGVGLHS